MRRDTKSLFLLINSKHFIEFAENNNMKNVTLQLVVSVSRNLKPERVAEIMQLALENGYEESQDRDNDHDPSCKDLGYCDFNEFKVV